jgi:hypothetical protein
LEEKFGVPLLIFCSSLIPPIDFLALLEFERERFEHLCVVLDIAFGASFCVVHGDLWW